MNKINIDISGSPLPGPLCGYASNILEKDPLEYFLWPPDTQLARGRTNVYKANAF